ncbi:MAG: 3-hydroxyacyl-CoA dehydrogenase NAD-binding domain-containing protein [Bacteroidetes bacterium]|nr:3-hydroxyacyl-CoA dehydrogenase NAD-binding domain-containing protein [Bacteroidota bacterium]
MSFPVIGIIGSGTMGSGIAQVAATFNHKVILYDSNIESLKKGIQLIENSLNRFVEKNKLTDNEYKSILNNILIADSIADLKNSDLILEAIIEDEDSKKKLYSKIEEIVSPNAVLASNTSSFSIEKLSSNLKIKNRFLGMHFFNPPVLMELVEIIFTSETDKNITDKVKELILSWKKIPVIVKDTSGFLVNRIARSFYLEALKILEEKIADIETVDWAMKKFGNFKMGPFELMDLIGIDVNFSVTESVYKSFNNNARFRPSGLQKKMVQNNLLGKKTGIGFYDYKNPEIKKTDFNNIDLGNKIFTRIISMLVNEAYFALQEKIATYNDIELAMQKGANYPKGLLNWGKEIGYKNIINILNNLETKNKDDRYKVCPLILELEKTENKNDS